MAHLIGYFLIMLIFMGIAIATANTNIPWVWYAIGAILQLLSLAGYQKTVAMYGGDITLYWVVYVLILIVSAIIIVKRKN